MGLGFLGMSRPRVMEHPNLRVIHYVTTIDLTLAIFFNSLCIAFCS